MVVSPNAHWLNFFLKREINVINWNYRGYGESDNGIFDFESAARAKLDAERVLAAALNKLKLTGKIGVYGRSIGGISACHLASEFSDIIDVLIVDRSLTEIEDVVKSKKPGSAMPMIFNFFSDNGWIC